MLDYLVLYDLELKQSSRRNKVFTKVGFCYSNTQFLNVYFYCSHISLAKMGGVRKKNALLLVRHFQEVTF